MTNQSTETQPPAANLYRLTLEQVAFIEKALAAVQVNGPLGQVRQVVATTDTILAALAWPVTVEVKAAELPKEQP